jgi:chromosomal replication initiation ATPase DnaA
MTPDQLIASVCERYSVSRAALRGRRRPAQLVHARAVAARLLRARTRMSLAEVGAVLGRDHSTVLHLLRPRPAADADAAELLSAM